jgi:hypothetical protein
MSAERLTAECSCGAVAFEAVGRPIASVVCYCDDCQAAAAQIEAMPGAARFRQDAGTPLVVFRKDRVRCIRGEPLVSTLKLREGSPTNRRLATCCNSVLVLDFDDAKHWADLFGARVQPAPPKPEMLVCTKFAAQPPANPDQTPVYPSYAPRFLFRLLGARLAMLVSR